MLAAIGIGNMEMSNWICFKRLATTLSSYLLPRFPELAIEHKYYMTLQKNEMNGLSL